MTGAPLQRVWHAHARLVREATITAESLARELEVSPSTVKRDIDMMRDRLGLPIAWDPVRHTYHDTRPCDTLPMLRIDAREALAFALASRMLGGMGNSPLGAMLEAVFRKVASVLGGSVSIITESVDSLLSSASTIRDEEVRHFLPLLEAIHERRVLQLAYKKPGAARPEARLVHPLHLAELDGCWALVAHDPRRAGVRKFLLHRIHRSDATGGSFEPPAGFDVAAYLAGSLGRFTGERVHEISVALDAHAAFYARERPWHRSQQLTDRPDGSAVLTLRLNNLTDIHAAVLRWGEHAEVLAPAELRDQVRNSLRSACERYAR